ncbi:MAG: hypothetical protein JNM07_12195 [Phycisphaerae bacterium]|nr:hypothetical protein [Phycisphaerae bacterium]
MRATICTGARVKWGVGAVLVLAAGAAARPDFGPVDRSDYHIYGPGDGLTYQELGDDWNGAGPRNEVLMYSSGISPPGRWYEAVVAAGTINGDGIYDDYRGTMPNVENIRLGKFKFVGGALQASGGVGGGTLVFFDFFDERGFSKGGFGVNLGVYGDQLFTVDLPDSSNVLYNNSGYVRMLPDDANGGNQFTTMRWFTTDFAEVGSNSGQNPADGSAEGSIFSFSLTHEPVPAPSAFGLLGLGGLLAARRKR